MDKEFTVYFRTNKSGFQIVDIYPENAMPFSLVDEIAEEMEERYGYKITNKLEGPDGTGFCDIETEEKKIQLLFDEGWGIEMHPHDKEAEKDVVDVEPYLKKVLESYRSEDSE